MTANRYYEDLDPGQSQASGTAHLSLAECLEFSRKFDPQPMHIDSVAAEKSRFRGLIASGWHTAAVAMKLIAEARMMGDTEMLGMGVEELRWHLPVRPGDTLQVTIEVVSKKPSESNPFFGIVKFKMTTKNQKDEVVMTHSPICWVPRREQAV